MAVSYEWDVEEYDIDASDPEAEIVDHNHANKLAQLPWLLNKNERLVLVRTTDEGDRQWAYVDESRMLPKHFAKPNSAGEYVETDVKVPQRFHREIAKVACGGK